MSDLRPFRPSDLPALVALWNRCFADSPNFITLTEADFLRRVGTVPGFDPARLLLATEGSDLLGYVHYGPRLEYWEGDSLRTVPAEGHIYALVAPPGATELLQTLLEVAGQRLTEEGAQRVLLYPSWVCGTQSMYNGVAGAYEMPGLSDTRTDLLTVAEAAGFTSVAEYGTPELPLAEALARPDLQAERARLEGLAAQWRLHPQLRGLRPIFFPNRRAVTLLRNGEIVAMTAFGPWEEYIRHYGRPLFGITSVQVDQDWRGRGLGKLVMLLALEAAQQAGAEAVHLHVYRSNVPAWNLYHKALGFQPKWTWRTLIREVKGQK